MDHIESEKLEFEPGYFAMLLERPCVAVIDKCRPLFFNFIVDISRVPKRKCVQYQRYQCLIQCDYELMMDGIIDEVQFMRNMEAISHIITIENLQ